MPHLLQEVLLVLMRTTSLPASFPRFGHVSQPQISISIIHGHSMVSIFWWCWWLPHPHVPISTPPFRCPSSHCCPFSQPLLPTPFPSRLLEALASTRIPDKFQQRASFIKQNFKNGFMSQRRNLLKIDFGFVNTLHMLELLPKCGKDLCLINL